MFCSKCGTQLPDASKFCSKCGAPVDPVATGETSLAQNKNIMGLSTNITIGGKMLQLDSNTIISIIMAIIMLLSASMLPMFSLYKYYGESSKTLSLLGDNYIDDYNTLSRIVFIFMLALTVATVIFKLRKMYEFSLFSAVINFGILSLYNIYIGFDWHISMYDSNHVAKQYVTLNVGNILCLLCAVGLCVLIFLDYKKLIMLRIQIQRHRQYLNNN